MRLDDAWKEKRFAPLIHCSRPLVIRLRSLRANADWTAKQSGAKTYQDGDKKTGVHGGL